MHPPAMDLGSEHYELRVDDWRANVFGPPTLLRELETLFSAVQQPPRDSLQGEATATFEVRSDASRSGWQQIVCDGAPLWTGQNAEVLAHLEWGINRTAAEWLGQRYLLFHAGSVAYAGRGLILPAPSGSGKTTLVAGLLAAGFAYLSDEVAMIETHTLSLLPFAKSLCVKAGGRDVLTPLYPGLAVGTPRRRFGGEPVWYLQPPLQCASSVAVPIQLVVLPSYQPGSVSALQPVARSVALQRLLEQSFNLRAHGAWGVGRLIDMLRQADCYSLSVASLEPAVDALLELAQES